MIKNYFKIAFRNVTRNKTSAFINIIGLGLGLCAFLLLMEYISLEQSVNKFHVHLPQMYRLINEDPAGKTWPEVEPGWASVLQKRLPEIKDVCRFDEETGSTIINTKNNSSQPFNETKTGYADGNFFSFFSFPLKAGKASSLYEPNVVFISETSAKKYFGDADPINQTLIVNNQFGKTNYTVEGVYADMKDNSDIKYNMLFSLETLKNPMNLNGNDWAAIDNLNSQYIQTFFYLNKGVNIKDFEKKLTALRTQLKADKDGVQFKLQAFKDIHLGGSFNDTYPTVADIKYVYMLSGITLLILLIAWFNYINLSTANSFKRANEVGVRKVIGASKKNLVFQFLSESLLLNIIALMVAIVLVIMLQPLFNKLINKQLSIQTIADSSIWIYGILLLLTGSILSGAYTAFSLSGYKPVNTLKGKIAKTTKGILLRKSLVVSQFTISIILIIATILIYSQVNYMQNKQLGLNPNQLLVIHGPQIGDDSVLRMNKQVFKDELSNQSFVKDFCTSGNVPSIGYNFSTSGFTQPASQKGDELKSYSFVEINDNYLNTYQIPLIVGRNFTAQECAVKWNSNSKVLMNEAAVKQLGFTNPSQILTTKIQWDERKLDVIGVIKDYNHEGAKKATVPIIFYPNNNSNYITVRLTADNIKGKISDLQKLYQSNFKGNPFEYFFLDDSFNKLYASEKQFGDIFTSASAWAIFIACLGLFGLVTFTVESRTKEIGIRKVLGATVSSIVSMLSKDFLLLVLIAFVIATPIAWFVMNKWLQSFAYRINMSWWVFIAGGLSAVMVALITLSFRAIKAAIANPVKSLRTE